MRCLSVLKLGTSGIRIDMLDKTWIGLSIVRAKVRIEMIVANIFLSDKTYNSSESKNTFQYYFQISWTNFNTFLFMKFDDDIVQRFCNHSRIGGFQIGWFKGKYPFLPLTPLTRQDKKAKWVKCKYAEKLVSDAKKFQTGKLQNKTRTCFHMIQTIWGTGCNKSGFQNLKKKRKCAKMQLTTTLTH